MTKPKYNTMLDVAFSVNHDFSDPEELLSRPEGMKLVMTAMAQRLVSLIAEPQEAAEAFGICDTYENQQDDLQNILDELGSRIQLLVCERIRRLRRDASV